MFHRSYAGALRWVLGFGQERALVKAGRSDTSIAFGRREVGMQDRSASVAGGKTDIVVS